MTKTENRQDRVTGLLMSGVWSAEDRYIKVAVRNHPGKTPVAFMDTLVPNVGLETVVWGDRHMRFKTQQTLAEAMCQTINEANEMKLLLRQFFGLLDTTETKGEHDRTFNPTYISTVRVQHSNKLREILPRLRELAELLPEKED